MSERQSCIGELKQALEAQFERMGTA